MRTTTFALLFAAAVWLGAEGGGQDIVTRRVWSNTEWGPMGSPSPDGTQLSFVDWNTGDLAIRDLRTGEERRITNLGFEGGFAESSRISPDGRWVAYTWYESTADSTTGGMAPGVRLIPIEGGESRVLVGTAHRYALPYDWSADGTRVLVGVTGSDGTTQVGLVDVDDAEFHLVTSLRGAWLGNVALSRDGKYVAYDVQRGERTPEHAVHVVAVDGRRDREVTGPGGHNVVVGWEPSGRYLLYYGDHTGSPSVWAVRTVEGRPQGEPVLIRSDLWHMIPLGFSAQGDLFYGVTTGKVDVFTVLTDPETGAPIGEPQSVTPPHQSGTALLPRWSPDGRYLAYRRTPLSGPGAGQSIVIRAVESGEFREIGLDVAVTFTPDWSTDGRFLVVNAQEGRTRGRNRQGAYRIDAQTGEHGFAYAIDGTMRGAAWLDDGRTILYKQVRMQEPQGCRFVTREIASGREREIYRWPCRSLDWWWTLSPDRRTIAGVFGPSDSLAEKPWTLRIVSVGDGAARDLAEFWPWVIDDAPGPSGWHEIFWTPDSRSFRFRGCLSPDQVIAGLNRCPTWSFDVATGERRRLADDAPIGSIHPDGRRVAFADGERAFEIWVMEDYLPIGE